MNKIKFKYPSSIDALLLVVFLGLIFISDSPGGDPGVFWHIQTGFWILENGNVPYIDPFLFTSQNTTWISDQWLADVLFAELYKLGGWPLLHVITFAIAIAAFLLITPIAYLKCSSSLLLTVITTLFVAVVGGVQIITRPVIFSFLFTSIVYTISWLVLCDVDKNTQSLDSSIKKLYFLPLVFLLWANLHPGFPLGFLILFLLLANATTKAIICKSPEKIKLVFKFAIICALCGLATLINPYGIKLYEQIFGLVSDPFFMHLNMEWLSPDFQAPPLKPFGIAIVILVFLFWLLGRSSCTWAEVILLVMFMMSSLLHRRYIPFFAIVSAVPFIKLLESARQYVIEIMPDIKLTKSMNRILSIPHWNGSIGHLSLLLFVVMASLTLSFKHIPFRETQDSGPHKSYPWKAISFIKDSLIKDKKNELSNNYKPLKIFATPDFGGAITFTLWPEAKAFIDDRNNLNGKERYEDYEKLVIAASTWREILKKYDFDVFLLKTRSPIIEVLKLTNEWKLAYQDDDALVFVKNDAIIK